MARRAFPVYDFVVFGFKGLFKHIRLFILMALGFFATIMGTMLLLGLAAYPFFSKVMFIGRDLKADMMTCVNKQECLGAIGRSLRQIFPFVTDYAIVISIGFLILMIVTIWLGTGVIRILLQLHDKGKSSARELWGTFRFVPRFFVAGILFSIVIGIGFAFFFIPGLYLLLRLFFWKMYIVDKDMGVIGCMKASWNATRGLGWELLGILIVGLSLMAVLPLIGLPVFALSTIAAYRKVQK